MRSILEFGLTAFLTYEFCTTNMFIFKKFNFENDSVKKTHIWDERYEFWLDFGTHKSKEGGEWFVVDFAQDQLHRVIRLLCRSSIRLLLSDMLIVAIKMNCCSILWLLLMATIFTDVADGRLASLWGRGTSPTQRWLSPPDIADCIGSHKVSIRHLMPIVGPTLSEYVKWSDGRIGN